MATVIVKIVPGSIIVKETPTPTVIQSFIGPPGTATVVDTFFRLKYTDVKTANYQAKVGESVVCDASGGSFTVAAPTSPKVDEIFALKLIAGGPASGLTVTVTNPSIECPKTRLIATQVILWTAREIMVWRYDGTTWRIESSTGQTAWTEVWQLTQPQTDISLSGTRLLFDYRPSTGQATPVLLTYNAGIFTYAPSESVIVEVNLLIKANFHGNNNSGATYQVMFQDVVTTRPSVFNPVLDSFQTSRTEDYRVSGSSFGGFFADQGDTYEIVATQILQIAQMNVDIEDAFLTITVP